MAIFKLSELDKCLLCINVHQFTSVGKVAGVNGNVDISYTPNIGLALAHPILGRI